MVNKELHVCREYWLILVIEIACFDLNFRFTQLYCRHGVFKYICVFFEIKLPF